MYQYLGSTGIKMYDLFNMMVTAVFVALYNFSNFKNKRNLLSNLSLVTKEHFSKKKELKLFASVNFWTFIEIIFITGIQNMGAYMLNNEFGKAVNTGTNYFGLLLFLPIVLYAAFYIIAINPLKQMDLITPSFPFALISIKLACFCAGCCNGIECSFGLYNHDTGLVEFPVQLVEAGLALLIFIFLLFWKKKAKEGTLFPIYVIMYSATRFFSEFLRSEPDIIWKLKTYHILCIVGVIIGIIELFVVLKFGDKLKELYGKSDIIALYKKIKKDISDYKTKRNKQKKNAKGKEKIYRKYK